MSCAACIDFYLTLICELSSLYLWLTYTGTCIWPLHAKNYGGNMSQLTVVALIWNFTMVFWGIRNHLTLFSQCDCKVWPLFNSENMFNVLSETEWCSPSVLHSSTSMLYHAFTFVTKQMTNLMLQVFRNIRKYKMYVCQKIFNANHSPLTLYWLVYPETSWSMVTPHPNRSNWKSPKKISPLDQVRL